MDQEWCPTRFRPVASPDQNLLAFVSTSHGLVVVEAQTGRQTVVDQLSKSVRQCLSDLSFIRWSPEVILGHETSAAWTGWLLLATSTRLVLIRVESPAEQPSQSLSASTVADYQFENHLGRITLAEWATSHKHALVVFETATQVSIVSTSKPERTDLALPKFAGYQGFAANPAKTCFAVILRSKGQDQIAIFAASENEKLNPIIFSPGTVDAQGLSFSPNGDPVLAVWDSATYGPKVVFFTAMGHPLRQLDINEQAVRSRPFTQGDSPMGISHLVWSRSRIYSTILAMGGHDGTVHIQGQNNKDMTVTTVASLNHLDTIDAALIPVWQETLDQTFTKPDVAINLHFDRESTFDNIQFNADTALIAIKLTNLPRAAWIWDVKHRTLVSVILFQHDVKQLLWHPTRPEILIVMTATQTPSPFCWYDVRRPPQAIHPPSAPSTTVTKWRGEWLEPAETTRCPFVLSGGRQFLFGLFGLDEDRVVFQGMSAGNASGDGGDDETTELIDTPSKPGRTRGAATSLGTDVDVHWSDDADCLW